MRTGILCIVLLMATVSYTAGPSFEEINRYNSNNQLEFDHSVEILTSTSNELSCRVHFDIDPSEQLSNQFTITKLIALPANGDPFISETQPIGQQFYQSDSNFSSYPTSPIKTGRPAIMRGVRVAPITISPCYYNQSEGKLVTSESYSFRVQFNQDGGTNPIQRPTRPKSPQFQRFLESSLINPPDRDDPVSRDDDFPYGGSWLYLVPDVDGIVDALEPLLEWRRQSGSSVQVEVAPDDRDGVKAIIQDAYNNWDIPPEYVVLVADADGENRLPPWEDDLPVTDHPYVQLEGDDILPDATIGRLSWNSIEELRIIVAKIVSYESDPEINNNDWLTHAVDCAAAESISSHIRVGRWIYDQMVEAGYDPVDTSFTVTEQQFADWLQEQIVEGTSLVLTRSMQGWDDDMVVATENAPNFPLMLMVSSNSGRFWREDPDDDSYPELWLRSEHGAIGALGAGQNSSRTAYTNLFAGSIIQGLLADRILSFGWALNRAKFELYRQYSDFANDQDDDGREWWETHTLMFNLMGDPGTKLWLGTPTSLDVDLENRLDRGNNQLYVTVLSEILEEPVANALVCLYSPDGLFLTGRTDAAGDYIFILPQDAMELESAKLTVTGEGLLPLVEEVIFREVELSVGVNEVLDIDDDGGDADGIMDYGEEIVVTVSIQNFGTATPPSPMFATLEDRSPYYSVIENPVEIEADLDPDQSVEVNFIIEIDPSCPNEVEIPFIVLIVDDEGGQYLTGFTSVSGAPKLVINDHIFPDGQLEPGSDVDFDIELLNDGNQTLDPTAVELVSLSNFVRVDVGEGLYDATVIGQPNRLSDHLFELHGSPQAIPGMSVPFELRLESGDGWRDTIKFMLEFAPAGMGDPFGPDRYGYICYDSEDIDFELAPEYDWIEIDPNLDGDGEQIDFGNMANNRDDSEVIDLPFEFVFYGEAFNQITVCTNGWIAPGSQPQFDDYRNRKLPTPLGTDGKICPFWDNLMGDDNSGIYTLLVDEGRFVVEWSRMLHRIEDGVGDRETFQVVIFDSNVYPTLTGDSQLQFQYFEVTDSPEGYSWDTPYSTVGIQGFTLNDYLLYCYWDEYVSGATVLEDELAILFTPNMIIHDPSTIIGTVMDAETDELMEGVQIEAASDRGLLVRAVSDQAGMFTINDLTAGEYEVIATFDAYNRYVERVNLGLGDTVRVDIDMLHPEFNVSSDSVVVTLAVNSDELHNEVITVTNNGNGEMIFTARLAIVPQNELRDDPWDRLLEVNITDVIDDDRITATVWAGDYLWVAGGNRGQNPPKFYFFDRNGEYIDQAPQPYNHRWGVRGMAFDGEFVWCYGDIGLVKLDLDLNVVSTLDGIHNNGRGIAYNPDSETLFLSGISGDNEDRVFEIDRMGNVITSFQHEYAVYGLGWYGEDPDGYPLYMTTNGWDDVERIVQIVKVDPDTEEQMIVYEIQQVDEDRGGGSDISGGWRPEVWGLITTINSPDGDRLEIYELGQRSTWISVDTTSGELASGGEMDITLTFNPTELELGEYDARLEFQHNAVNQQFILPIHLTIDEGGSVTSELVPQQFMVGECHPNPFNSMTQVSFYLPNPQIVKAGLYDITGRQVSELTDRKYSFGEHIINVDAKDLPSGVYMIRLSAGKNTAFRKMTLIQ